jgi:hypothetical protein
MNDLIDGLDKDQPVAMSWIYTATVTNLRCSLSVVTRQKQG